MASTLRPVRSDNLPICIPLRMCFQNTLWSQLQSQAPSRKVLFAVSSRSAGTHSLQFTFECVREIGLPSSQATAEIKKDTDYCHVRSLDSQRNFGIACQNATAIS